MTSKARCIIALCGYKGCGKDYVAKYIEKNYDYQHLKISFKLKEMVKSLFDLNDEQIEGVRKEQLDEKWNKTPRQIMQFIGTDVFQYNIQELMPIGRDFWIKSFVNNLKSTTSNIVISDMRFLHEYKYLKNEGHTVHVIQIINQGPTEIYSLNDEHQSESEFIQIPSDYYLYNDMTKPGDTVGKIEAILKCTCK
jgi:dephospho-CoA kinase